MPLSQPDSEPYVLISGLNFYHGSSAAEPSSSSSMPGSQGPLLWPVYQMIARVTPTWNTDRSWNTFKVEHRCQLASPPVRTSTDYGCITTQAGRRVVSALSAHH